MPVAPFCQLCFKLGEGGGAGGERGGILSECEALNPELQALNLNPQTRIVGVRVQEGLREEPGLHDGSRNHAMQTWSEV